MSSPPGEPAWVGDVLEFWFHEIGERGWYSGGPDVDVRVRERFAALHARVAAGTEEFDASRPRDLLAAIIVLDQFSRHLHRGTAAAFAGDSMACHLARTAVEQHLDAGLTSAERQFLYMPLQHSEDRANQALSVRLVSSLGNAEWTRYAVDHHDVIEKFGRFPHRNGILGRNSTSEETEFLKEPNSSF